MVYFTQKVVFKFRKTLYILAGNSCHIKMMISDDVVIAIIFSFSSTQADLLPGVFGLWVCPVCPRRPVHSCLSAVWQDWHWEHLLWYVHSVSLQGSKHCVALCTHTGLGWIFDIHLNRTLKEENTAYQNYLNVHRVSTNTVSWLLRNAVGPSESWKALGKRFPSIEQQLITSPPTKESR